MVSGELAGVPHAGIEGYSCKIESAGSIPVTCSNNKGAMLNELGKRYKCTICYSEILCVKSSNGIVCCCDVPMVQYYYNLNSRPTPGFGGY